MFLDGFSATEARIRFGDLMRRAVEEGVSLALRLDIVLYGDADLHRRAFQLTRRFFLPTTHDVHYLALSERLGTEFWTTDRRLVQAIQGGGRVDNPLPSV